MRRRDMKCVSCDYFHRCGPQSITGLEKAFHGECRRNPPGMHRRQVLDKTTSPVFEDTSLLKVPLCYETLVPAFPLVHEGQWCGQGRWSTDEGPKYWGDWDEV